MLNRLPPEATKGIPREIIQEHGNLLWISRSLADLEKFPRSERVNNHYDRVIGLLDPSAETHGHANPEPLNRIVEISDDTGFRSLEASGLWYHQFLVPGSVIDWLSNLTIGDGILFATGAAIMVVILIAL
jgi:hypothetical protein